MFDLISVWEMLKVEPGHGFVQTLVLLGIWFTCKGVRRDLKNLVIQTDSKFVTVDNKLKDHEGRIIVLEKGRV